MSEATIIFPHQLFEKHPAVSKGRPIFLIEHPHFFNRLRFHKQKLVFHHAAMFEFKVFLENQHHSVTLVDPFTIINEKSLVDYLKKRKISVVHCAYIHDVFIEEELKKAADSLLIDFVFYDSPYFMTAPIDLTEHFQGKERYYFTTFYHKQRRHFNILMELGKPIQGVYSFDPKNRLKIPHSIRLPEIPQMTLSYYVKQAKTWVEENYPDNPGSFQEWIYPTTFNGAQLWLENFFEHRFRFFGPYQDALAVKHPFAFHSLLSPFLNSGLLEPSDVVEQALLYAQNHAIPINSLEGFIRQIIGWREYVYGLYRFKEHTQRNSNFFNHTTKLPNSFWLGTTSIEPIDNIIAQLDRYAYAHHIERLMVVGNFMLLCEIDPDDVYRWFMELFIDSYDWVMVPNVYGMSQYADGGLMVTKPYIASSHYLKKMSDYKDGVWQEILDALYWRFIYKNYKLLDSIPRMRMIMVQFKKMRKQTLKEHVLRAELFLKLHF